MNLSFKRVYCVTLIAAALLVLTACGGGTPDQNLPEGKTVSFVGTWHTEDKDGQPEMVAEITADSILINWSTTDAAALYWAGDFNAPGTVLNGTTVVSKGDTDKMAEALLASQDAAKTFTYEDGDITFPMSMMGVETTVRLVK